MQTKRSSPSKDVDRLKRKLEKKNKVIATLSNELTRLRNEIKGGLDPQTIIEEVEKTQKAVEKVPNPARTEKDLIARLKRLYHAGELSTLTTHWRIGKAIATYYEEKNRANYESLVKRTPKFTPEIYDEFQAIAYKSGLNGKITSQTNSPLAKDLEFLASKFIEGKMQAIVRSKIRERSRAYKAGVISRYQRKKLAKKYSRLGRFEGKRKRLAKEHDVDDGRIYREYHKFVSGLGRIAEKLDMDRATLGKCCQFAKEYTKEDLEAFSAAKFTLSWPVFVKKNLDTALRRDHRIKSRELMDIVQNVTTINRYIEAVSKWEKDADVSPSHCEIISASDFPDPPRTMKQLSEAMGSIKKGHQQES